MYKYWFCLRHNFFGSSEATNLFKEWLRLTSPCVEFTTLFYVHAIKCRGEFAFDYLWDSIIKSRIDKVLHVGYKFSTCVWVSVCVCVWERERQRERERDKEREWESFWSIWQDKKEKRKNLCVFMFVWMHMCVYLNIYELLYRHVHFLKI